MKILGIDTATEACSVALWDDGMRARRFVRAGRGHSELLRPMVAEVLREAGLRVAEIDGFVGGIGPGSFAGLRIGVAFVQGLAAAHERPVVGISSLELLALQGFALGADEVLAAIDARMSEVYVAQYRRNAEGFPEVLVAPSVCAPTAVTAVSAMQIGIGSGWSVYGDALGAALGKAVPARCVPEALPDIADGMAWAAARFTRGDARAAADLQPLYLRNKVALTSAEQAAARKGG
jgi:tRNA threonylcarbamoyladenosine biosynthesis protein TsaB